MKTDAFWGNSKIMCSAKAEEGAARLIEHVQNHTLPMDILPNRYDRFSGELEQEDYVSYCRFLESMNGQKVLNMLEEEDAGEYVEL